MKTLQLLGALLIFLHAEIGSAASISGGGSGLPAGGTVSDCVINTAPGIGTWQACPGAAGGDSVSVDGVAVVDPNFDSTGDIDFINTANVVTGNVKADSVALGTDTTGGYAGSATEGGSATTADALAANPTDCGASNFANAIAANGNLTCAQPAFTDLSGAATDAQIPNNITIDLATTATTANTGDSATSFFSTGTIEDARLPSSMADKTVTGSFNIPHSITLPATCVVGDQYMDTDATTGQRHYLCEATNTWVLQGASGAGDVTAAAAFSTDNVLIKSDGTGKGVQATGISVADTTHDISGAGSVQFGPNPADAGRVRLSNNESICWELATPGTDKCLTLNASDEFELNAPLNLTGTPGPMLQTGVASPSAPAGAEQWYFYADSVDDLPKYIYTGGAEQTFFTTANPQTTATTPSANDNDTSIATTAYVQTELTAYASDTVTFTGKSLDCGGTGNACTIKKEYYEEVAGCNNATAGPIWNLPTSNAATATCDTGTNQFSAFMAFADAANQSIHRSFRLPTGFTGAIDWLFRYKVDAGTTGAVGWCAQLVRLPTGSAADPAFPALASGNCVSSTVPGTAGFEGEAIITGVTCTSCAAGDRVFVRVSRDGTGSVVTDGATGVGRLTMTGPAYAVVY